MPDPPEQPPPDSQPSFQTRWLGWRILALSVFVMILLSPVFYRGWRLGQVPVTDEPFDVEEFLGEIPRDENSYFDFEEAGRELREIPRNDYQQYNDELETGWDFDTAVLDRHLENNRIALETWLAATENNQYQPPAKWSSTESPLIAIQSTRELHRLANTQIQKLDRMNRPAEAIPWIEAQFRFAHLIRQRGIGISHSVGVAVFSEASKGTNAWSAHPELGRAEIELARQKLETARKLNPPPSERIKAEYLEQLSFFEFSTEKIDPEDYGRSSFGGAWQAWIEAEPEYSFRLFSHSTRNHLLFIDAPRRSRPYLVEGQWFEETTLKRSNRGRLSPEEIAVLFDSSWLQLSASLQGTLNSTDRDEARYRCLTVALAAQACFRDHGEFPEKASELVPEYLDEIPDDLYSPTPAPLIYRRDGDGAVVYSRFTNEFDDGGTQVNYDERRTGGDLLDLGFRIRNPFNRPLTAPKPDRP